MNAARRLNRPDAKARALRAVASVADPEIPVLSITELGIVREIAVRGERSVRVALSPTYTGCPATRVIHRKVEDALCNAGFDEIHIDTVIAPPWTTDWISEAGRTKLRDYGIAPPVARAARDEPAICPRCASRDTERISEFGSTPCKALHRCRSCLEPFDQFKCL